MVHSVVVETPCNGCIHLYIDGKDMSEEVCSADIKLRAGKLPMMTLQFPFRHLEMNDIELEIKGLEDDHN